MKSLNCCNPQEFEQAFLKCLRNFQFEEMSLAVVMCFACQEGYPEIVRYLCETESDVVGKITQEHVEWASDFPEIVKYLERRRDE